MLERITTGIVREREHVERVPKGIGALKILGSIRIRIPAACVAGFTHVAMLLGQN